MPEPQLCFRVYVVCRTPDGTYSDLISAEGFLACLTPPPNTPNPDKNSGPPDTCDGNPLNVATGNKYQPETDLAVSTVTPLSFTRAYNSTPTRLAGLGHNWTHTYASSIQFNTPDQMRVAITRPDGRTLLFVDVAGNWQSQPDITDRLERLTDETGQPAGWRYTVAKDRSLETYNTEGRLVSIARADGTLQTLTYTGDKLTQVQDHNGRTLQFTYDAQGRIHTLTDMLGQTITYTYTADDLLARIQYPDTTQRQYHYNEAAFINNGTACSATPEGFPTALTGITDQNGIRYATFTYDCTGRATSSAHAGGADHVRLTFTTNNSTGTTVTDPLGNPHTYGFKTIQGVTRRTTASQPAGSGCGAATAQFDYDTNGNITSRTDFNSTKTCSAYELTRNLETARVEGLPSNQNCGTALAANTLGEGQRKISTRWHPDWPLVTQRAAPNRITTSVYNGQPDPSNGNQILTCAPVSAKLPDGQPLAVLCKQIEQPTSDTDGSKGFNATQVGNPRITQWTYNANGQILTERLPGNQTFTYTYALSTTTTHTRGDLLSVTDTLGFTTTYTHYDKAGRLLESVDTNGAVTRLTYDVRGRLTEQNMAGQTARYTYTPVGQLSTVTQSDGYILTHTYDAAHRLSRITDNRGNRIAYTLDAAGNLTRETVTDPSNQLTRAVTRHYDALQRVRQTVRGE